jgi:hypothetical protein
MLHGLRAHLVAFPYVVVVVVVAAAVYQPTSFRLTKFTHLWRERAITRLSLL